MSDSVPILNPKFFSTLPLDILTTILVCARLRLNSLTKNPQDIEGNLGLVSQKSSYWYQLALALFSDKGSDISSLTFTKTINWKEHTIPMCKAYRGDISAIIEVDDLALLDDLCALTKIDPLTIFINKCDFIIRGGATNILSYLLSIYGADRITYTYNFSPEKIDLFMVKPEMLRYLFSPPHGDVFISFFKVHSKLIVSGNCHPDLSMDDVKLLEKVHNECAHSHSLVLIYIHTYNKLTPKNVTEGELNILENSTRYVHTFKLDGEIAEFMSSVRPAILIKHAICQYSKYPYSIKTIQGIQSSMSRFKGVNPLIDEFLSCNDVPTFFKFIVKIYTKHNIDDLIDDPSIDWDKIGINVYRMITCASAAPLYNDMHTIRIYTGLEGLDMNEFLLSKIPNLLVNHNYDAVQMVWSHYDKSNLKRDFGTFNIRELNSQGIAFLKQEEYRCILDTCGYKYKLT